MNEMRIVSYVDRSTQAIVPQILSSSNSHSKYACSYTNTGRIEYAFGVGKAGSFMHKNGE